jgi:hypothetical protein
MTGRAVALLLVCIAMVCALVWSGTPGHGKNVTLEFNPANFAGHAIDNAYFPLTPGTTFFYEGESDGVPTTDVTQVTHDTRLVDGVWCVVVWDRGFEDGTLVEETFDWYAQDESGNVWYLGEDATEYPSGSKEGSWEAGVEGALPGIIMEAHPQVGDRYSQELAVGVAEDMAMVQNLNRTLTTPLGSFDDLLLTREWSPLEKGVTEHKYYARGVGFIYGVMVKGGDEFSELMSITTD